MAGSTGEIVTIDVATGDERNRSTSAGADVLWLNYSDDGELLVASMLRAGVDLTVSEADILDGLVAGLLAPAASGRPAEPS